MDPSWLTGRGGSIRMSSSGKMTCMSWLARRREAKQRRAAERQQLAVDLLTRFRRHELSPVELSRHISKHLLTKGEMERALATIKRDQP